MATEGETGGERPGEPASLPSDDSVMPEQPPRLDRGAGEPSRPGRADRTRASVRRHPVRWLLGVELLAAALIALIWYWHRTSAYEDTNDAQIEGHISPVSTRVNGTVVKVYVEDNDRVAVGQLLVELDPHDYQVAVQDAEARLARAKAQLEGAHPNLPITATTTQTQISTTSEEVTNARAGVAAAARSAASAAARVREAQANAAKARADLARYRYLLAQNATTKERWDEALAAAKAANATVAARRAALRAERQAVEQARARLKQAESHEREANRVAPKQVAIQSANVDAARAKVKAAQAQLDQAQLNLGYTRIVSPIAGVVGRRNAEPGARVQPGQVLLDVVDVAHVWATANFKETQLAHMRVGQAARIHVATFDIDLHGHVESMPGATGARFSLLPPENATGNYVKVVQRLPVRIAIDPGQDPDDRLRPGMSVEPKVYVR